MKVPQKPHSGPAGETPNLAAPISLATLRAPGISLRDAIDGFCPSAWYEEPIELPESASEDYIVCHVDVSQ